MRNLLILSLFLGTFGVVNASSANPFEQGTQALVLSQEERAGLLEYADNSKAKLEQALEDAKGLPFSQIQEIYLSAIKKVVIESAVSKPRSELLMRYALNQALELTYGIPTADGKGIAQAGVLKNSANQNLLVQILEDSIHVALNYYQDDRKAIASGNLLNLPYAQLAQERLSLVRTKWLPAVLEWGFQYNFSIAVLKQFLATIANEEQQRKAVFAEEILKSEGWLSAEQQNWPRSWPELHKRVRLLRKNIGRLSISATTKSIRGRSSFTQTFSSPELLFEDSSYFIVAEEGYCLEAANYMGQVVRTACRTGWNLPQQTEFIKQRNGFFSIKLFGNCLAALDGVDTLTQYNCNDYENQQYKIEKVAGQVRIHPKANDQYCLDYVAGDKGANAPLKVLKCNGTASQLFSFKRVSE